MLSSSTSTVLIVSCLLLHAIMTNNMASAYPSGSSYCAEGDYKRFGGGGTCTCLGTVYYCCGNSNNCAERTSSGSIGCNNGVFGARCYGNRKKCACKPSGCPAGQKGPVGSCSSCTTGQYQGSNTFEGNSCSNCPAGQYQNQNGMSNCKSCGGGQYQGSNGQSSCGNCGEGQYQNSGGQTSCKNCPSGQYADQNSRTGCKGCAAGKWQNNNGMSSCKSCSAGQCECFFFF